MRFLLPLIFSLALLLGCTTVTSPVPASPYLPGGGNNNSGSNSTAVLVNLGGFDSVPTKVVSFSLTIESVKLQSPTGDIELVAPDGTYRRFEFTRQSLWQEPLAFRKVPAGGYSGVVITISSPRVTFVDANGILHENVAASLTSPTQTINAAFPIGSVPVLSVLRLHGDSVSFGAGDVVNVTPHFDMSGPWEVQNGFGAVQGLVGRVTRAGNGGFGLAVGNDLPCCFPGEVETFTFATNSNTQFEGVAGANALTKGMTVEVDALFYSDGSLRANKVALVSNMPTAVVFEGLVLEMAPAQLKLWVRDVHFPYELLYSDAIPAGGIVNVTASTDFRIDSEDVDLANLEFSPTFDALTVAAGQNIRVMATSATNSANPDQLKLEQQSLEGFAGSLSSGLVPHQYSFPLTFRPDSALAKITGADSVVVVVQPSTYLDTADPMAACISCIAGKHVRTRGLLFNSGGQYRLVATEVSIN
jgi:hypothetical protein